MFARGTCWNQRTAIALASIGRVISGIAVLAHTILVGCDGGGDNINAREDCYAEPYAIGWALRTDAVNPSARGFLSCRYSDEDGDSHVFVVFVPHRRPPVRKLPVLLFLNGAGEKGIDGVNQISNNFGLQDWELQGLFPFLAVCPQCREGGSWSAGSLWVAVWARSSVRSK